MHDIILSFITSSKIRQKPRSPRGLMCLLQKNSILQSTRVSGVKQTRVPSGRRESQSIWHQMLTNIWIHNIGTCIISSYPSLQHRKSDWNRISCENFAEISIPEPFRSQPGSQMADRSQVLEMSTYAVTTSNFVSYHLCGPMTNVRNDFCWHMTCFWSSQSWHY